MPILELGQQRQSKSKNKTEADRDDDDDDGGEEAVRVSGCMDVPYLIA